MKAYIVLENKTVFCGDRFGYEKDALGELVFTTGMGGYIETLTDPSYYGQIVIQTFPLIGNYGFISEDAESKKSYVSGYVVNSLCDTPSNFRCEKTLDEFLKEQKIAGICNVDTRHLTKIIRENGVMNAKITNEIPENFDDIKNYKIYDAVKSVSCTEKTHIECENKKFNVALVDLGAKRNIARELVKRGCNVDILPYDTSPDVLLKYDGVMLSNGPGDPSENTNVIKNIQSILGKVPIFGICLGHQLLALANGAKTFKLKYGHRGVNQPVKNLETGRVYISSQNHGYAVDISSLPNYADVTYENANDKTCEGLSYGGLNAFSVQFHPEACSGPKDTNFLFDKFIQNMEVK